MRLENTKSLSFSYLVNIFQLTVLKYYLNILDSRETAKEQINKSLTLFNYFCFWLSIFPFLWFICKLPVATNKSTLITNLPGLYPFSNDLAWETLLTSFDYNENLFNQIEKLEINSNSFLLTHKNINQSIQTLINFSPTGLKEQVKELKPREADSLSFLFKFTDLDEIPNKLESNLSSFNSTESFTTLQTQNKTNSGLNKKESEKGTKSFFSDRQSEEQNLKISIAKEKTKLKLFKSADLSAKLTAKLPSDEKQPGYFTRKILTNWTNFSQASELLNRYSRNLVSTQFSKPVNFQTDFAVKPSEVLSLRPRAMTGYQYPDLGSSNVWKIKVSNFFKAEKTPVTVSYYPQSIYFASFHDFQPFTNNKIVPPRYEIAQLGTGESVLVYDKENSDVGVKNRFSTQLSLFQQGIVNNFETLKPLYFFANNDKTDLLNLVTGQLGELNEKTSTNLNHSIFSTTTLFSLRDTNLSPELLNKVYHQLPVENSVIPMVDLRNEKIYFGPNTITFQNFKNVFTNTNVPALNNLFSVRDGLVTKDIQVSTNLLSTNEVLEEYSPNLYKREIGSYWKTKINQTEEFVTVNEVLTTHSILSVSLFGFLISTFLILKTAYADYAKEFSSYLLDLISSGKGLILDPSTIEWLNQELGLEEKKGGIRVFPKQFSKKRFTDIAGIKQLLPELSELVWFLRNKGRKFSITPLTSKSILLVGPPGTGKTLLVQALAGEAEVPVVAQSTSVLASMNQDLTPGDAIRLAFQKARSLSPCILFLDELDSFGLKRDSLLTNNSQQLIGLANEQIQSIPFFEKTTSHESDVSDTGDSDYLTNQLRISITNEFNSKKQQEREQVAALTQLLIEIDGLQANAGILVIGATNRAQILDPALTRPGRFSKIIALPLPDKAKRIEIFKLRAIQLGWESTINWDYLAQRTKGFSAGDLATIVNQSAIQAILDQSKHTLESFEQAITVLTTYAMEKPKTSSFSSDPYSLKREVYYKVAQSFYNYHENVIGKTVFVELSSRQPNPRHYQILENLNNDKNQLRTRNELEKLLTSLVSGKAGELLMLLTTADKSGSYWESDLSTKDFYEATKLVLVMFQEWYLYTSPLQQQKFLLIPTTQNQVEYRKNEELFSLFEETVRYLEQQLTSQFSFTESLSQRAQWKSSVLHEMTSIDSLFAEWSRFHFPDPQETERNPEWIPPEEYYHATENKRITEFFETKSLNQTNELLPFSELLLIERDRYIQTVLLSAFNKAFSTLETNRELLDLLACFLFKHKILRSFELSDLINKYTVRS